MLDLLKVEKHMIIGMIVCIEFPYAAASQQCATWYATKACAILYATVLHFHTYLISINNTQSLSLFIHSFSRKHFTHHDAFTMFLSITSLDDYNIMIFVLRLAQSKSEIFSMTIIERRDCCRWHQLYYDGS